MWLENINELKKTKKMSVKDISTMTKLPERSIARVFSGEVDNPYITTLIPIVNALGGSLDEIFADTNAVVGSKNLVELQNTLQAVQTEKEHLIAENTVLLNKVSVLNAENEIYKMKLRHKEEELQAIYNYYHKLKTE